MSTHMVWGSTYLLVLLSLEQQHGEGVGLQVDAAYQGITGAIEEMSMQAFAELTRSLVDANYIEVSEDSFITMTPRGRNAARDIDGRTKIKHEGKA
jgi:hypothetical protein